MNRINNETLYQLIESKEFLKKYSLQFTEPVLEKLSIDTQLMHFNWSKFCYNIIDFYPEATSPPIEDLVAFELFGIATRLLDDMIDEDNQVYKNIDNSFLLLLYSDLLVYSLHTLSLNNFSKPSILNDLQGALNGEFYDSVLNLENNMSESDYFDFIVQKSSKIFTIAIHLLDIPTEDLLFWTSLLKKIGIAAQLKNDLQGLFNINSADIDLLKPTFPLIKLVENDSKSLSFLKKNKNINFKKDLEKLLEKSGVLDYSLLIFSIYKSDILDSLKIKFPNKTQQIANFLSYLNLGEHYAKQVK